MNILSHACESTLSSNSPNIYVPFADDRGSEVSFSLLFLPGGKDSSELPCCKEKGGEGSLKYVSFSRGCELVKQSAHQTTYDLT